MYGHEEERTYKTQRLELRLTTDEITALDRLRGDTSRSEWLRQAIRDASPDTVNTKPTVRLAPVPETERQEPSPTVTTEQRITKRHLHRREKVGVERGWPIYACKDCGQRLPD